MQKKIVLATLSLLPLATMSVDASQVGVVTTNTLNVRNGAGQGYTKLFTLSKDEKVTIKSSSNGWYNIVNSKNKEGWASAQYIKISEDTTGNVTVVNKKIVSTNNLNMRSGASTSYRVLRVLSKGTEVEVISSANNWTKIKHNGIIGYVSSEYLADNNSNGNTNTSSVMKYVNTNNLNVRSGPSTSYSIVGKLKLNEKVEVLSQTSTWSKILYNGKTSYISSQYLSDSASNNNTETTPQIQNKKVNTTSLNVRSGPGTSYSKLGSLYKGNVVKALSESNGWVEISFNNKKGYVSSEYLLNTSESENIGSSGSTSGSSSSYVSVSYSLNQHIEVQYAKALKGGNRIDASLSTGSGSGYINATRSDLAKYLNPDNFTGTQRGLNQFLKIDNYKDGVTVAELNSYLNSLALDSTGKNVFHNKGAAFINAAKKHDIDLAYFVAHAMVETGYGRSTLAKGQYVGNVMVYNFFGIAAFDGTAVSSGKNYAYKMGWTSVEKTLDGSAKWIADNYIKSSYKQNTLYKMRWSYNYSNHQYATDVNWANLIASVMTKITPMYNSGTLKYEIPKYM